MIRNQGEVFIIAPPDKWYFRCQKEKETALLMKLGKVDRFDNGVFCTYAMQRDGPYDAVVVMEDGARGMNFCMSIRGYSKDVPLLWISDQAEFEPQSRRMQADTFLVKPVTEYQLRPAVSISISISFIHPPHAVRSFRQTAPIRSYMRR